MTDLLFTVSHNDQVSLPTQYSSDAVRIFLPVRSAWASQSECGDRNDPAEVKPEMK